MWSLYLFSATVIACCIVACIYVLQQYKKTTYYKATGNSYLAVRFDTGLYGEYLTYKGLCRYEKEGAKFLFNCYLPRDNGETTEIDVLMIYKSGLYVFESKNYSGWIFGSEYGKTWTQTLPQGRKAHKEHFLNPIMQNKLHIKWLKNFIEDEAMPIHSIIVFSERCTLKKVDVNSPDVTVIKRDKVYKTVAKIDSKVNSNGWLALDQNKVAGIYNKLYPFTQASSEVKQKHIEDIQQRAEKKEQEKKTKQMNRMGMTGQADQPKRSAVAPLKSVENKVVASTLSEEKEKQICPRCGAELVLRTAKKGENAGRSFYGCSSFPRCRYVREVG